MSKKQKSKEKNIPASGKKKSPSIPFLSNFRWISLLIGVYCFVLYFNTLSFDYCGDDTILIKENKLVNHGLGKASLLITKGTFFGYNQQNYGAYRPLAMLSFATEAQVFGMNPFIGHLVNILIYICCGILLYRLLIILFPRKELVALLITLLFLSHPVHSEVVANIKSLDELLAFLLSFLTPCYIFLNHGTKNKSLLIIALASFFFGLFAKETAPTFLFPILLAIYFFRNVKLKEIFISYFLPLLILVGVYIGIRNLFLDPPPPIELSITNTLQHTHTFSEKAGTILFILLKNMEKLVFPLNLSWDYSYKEIPITELFSAASLLSLLIHLFLILYAIMKTKSKSIIAFFIWFYFGSIVLFSHTIVSLAPNMADRFLFVPALCFSALLVIVFGDIIKRLKSGSQQNLYLVVPVVTIAILFSIRTIARNPVWKNNETMFRSGIVDAPNSYYCYQTLGQYLSAMADSSVDANEKHTLYTEAVQILEKGNEICPEVQDNWYLQGRSAFLAGDLTKAEYAYQQANIRFDKPKKESLYNLAVLYKNQKKYKEAINLLKQANEQKENFMNLYSLLGEIYLTNNELDSAQVYLNKAFEKNPSSEDLINNLGVYYFSKQDYKKAAEYFSQSVQLYPCSFNGIKNLAATYQNQNNFEQAIQLYQKLIQCYPNSDAGYVSLISLYSARGNSEQVKYYQQKLNEIKKGN